MLIRTNSRNEKGRLYISLIKVSTKRGGLWDIGVFFKRTNDESQAKAWHDKLLEDAWRGKWNIFNTETTLRKFIRKYYKFIEGTAAGQDTLEMGYLNTPKENHVCDGKTYKPDMLVTGGWDPKLHCNPEGGECILEWNCGTRSYPEDCMVTLKYDKIPHVLSTHDFPGTVSMLHYYIWNFPKGWEVLIDYEG